VRSHDGRRLLGVSSSEHGQPDGELVVLAKGRRDIGRNRNRIDVKAGVIAPPAGHPVFEFVVVDSAVIGSRNAQGEHGRAAQMGFVERRDGLGLAGANQGPRTTIRGADDVCATAELVDPNNMPAKPPRPWLPTTTNWALRDSSAS